MRLKALAPYAVLAAALIGYAASIVGYLEYVGSIGVCKGLGESLDCERVYSIPQARIAGVHLSEAAPVYFTALSLAAIAHAFTGLRAARVALAILSIPAALAVPYLVYLEVFVAEAICVWCTVMHVSILAVAAYSARALRAAFRPYRTTA